MISLTRLNGSIIFLNPDQIQSIEETPDSHITLMNGNRFIVLERAWMISDKIITYKAIIMRRASTSLTKKYLKKRHSTDYQLRCEYAHELL